MGRKAAAGKPAEGAGVPPPRILVVDDDPQTKSLMVDYLGHLGYEADTVSSGTEALDALCRVAYGVVFLDCMMPGMGGVETARRIRALETPDGLPRILGFSGEDRLDLRLECLAAGMDGFLPKPFTEKDLRKALEYGP